MRMDGLARLHASMQAIDLDRVKFRIQHNHLVFSGLFLADVVPYELALACLGHDLVLIFDVSRDYEIGAYLGDQYGPLAAALRNGAGRGNPLQPSVFLREIDAALPSSVVSGDRPTRADVVQVYRDVEEANKVYLCGWRDNDVRGECVSAANLAKTRRLLGQATYDWCKRRNISTCWADDPSREISAGLPSL